MQVAIPVANYDELLPHRWETRIVPDSSLSIEVSGKPAVETTHAPIERSRATRMTLVSVEPSNGTLMCVAGNGAVGRR